MFDTVHLELKQSDCKDNLLNAVINNANVISEGNHLRYGYSVEAMYRNMKIYVNDHSLKMRNSLAKSYFGNNVQILSLAEIKAAITPLSDTLHLPIETANITRLDVGFNVEMKYSPKTYFDYLKPFPTSRTYERCKKRYGITYEQGKKVLSFYDKSRKYGREQVPKLLRVPNLLRYEMQWQKDVHQAFDRTVTATDLYNIDFCRDVLEKYLSAYHSIPKLIKPKVMKSKAPITTKQKDDSKFFELIGLQGYGIEKYLAEVKEKQERKEICAVTAKRKRASVEKLLEFNHVTETYDMVNELNTKISKAVAMFN